MDLDITILIAVASVAVFILAIIACVLYRIYRRRRKEENVPSRSRKLDADIGDNPSITTAEIFDLPLIKSSKKALKLEKSFKSNQESSKEQIKSKRGNTKEQKTMKSNSKNRNLKNKSMETKRENRQLRINSKNNYQVRKKETIIVTSKQMNSASNIKQSARGTESLSNAPTLETSAIAVSLKESIYVNPSVTIALLKRETSHVVKPNILTLSKSTSKTISDIIPASPTIPTTPSTQSPAKSKGMPAVKVKRRLQ